MSHYKPYPAYKDSGVEWLGKVPEHWSINQMKSSITSLQNGVWGDEPNGDADDVPCARVADFDRVRLVVEEPLPTIRSIPIAQRTSKRVSSGDLLLEKSGGGEQTTVGAMVQYIGGLDVVCSNFVAVVKCKPDISARWLCYVNSHLYNLGVNTRSIKQTTGIQNLDSNQYSSELIAFPTFLEQQLIAAHLDCETARIDALISKKTRFIELLREKRQALITHAVTQGLDPSVKMKDSGVEWLGEVPEHWEVKPIKWLSPVQRGASPRPIDDPKYFDDDGKHGWVRIEDVTSSGGYLKETKQKLSELGSSLSVKLPIGSLFLSIAGTVGKPCISLVDACIHDGFVYFPFLKISPEWLFRVFECKTPFVGLGKMGTQLNLNTETVGGIFVGLPPAEEVQNILEVMKGQLARIDTIIGRSERSIELLKERRSALITAAVTGQIDLREAV